jgi:hypothetical protein
VGSGSRRASFYDEYLLTPSDVHDLSEEWRLAYVARLVKSLALMYGGCDDPLAGEAAPETPAGILRGLNDISWTPMTSEGNST